MFGYAQPGVFFGGRRETQRIGGRNQIRSQKDKCVRKESSVVSISWIPSESIEGLPKLPFEMVGHYDAPPPGTIDSLEDLRRADRFRFANELNGWAEIEDGKIVEYGQSGKGHIGVTVVRVGPSRLIVPAAPMPEIRPNPELRADSVRFVQTAGGRTGLPFPRPVPHKPFFQYTAPLAWTTLALTIRADGTSQHELAGASPFPRHWIYRDGELVAKSGLINAQIWIQHAFGERTPWGAHDSPALMTEAESCLERELSSSIMGGTKPEVRKIRKGDKLVEQGAPGDELYLLLDGVLSVQVNGETVADVGPGVILGERAVLEKGTRTASLVAVTDCKVAVANADQVDREALARLAEGHRREYR